MIHSFRDGSYIILNKKAFRYDNPPPGVTVLNVGDNYYVKNNSDKDLGVLYNVCEKGVIKFKSFRLPVGKSIDNLELSILEKLQFEFINKE